jgi:hypothetical protein
MIRQVRTSLSCHAHLIAVGLCAGVVAYGIMSAVAKSPQADDQTKVMIRPYSETQEPKPLVQPGDEREKSRSVPGRKKQTSNRAIKRGNLVLHVPKERDKLTPALSSYELYQRREKRGGGKKEANK